MKNKIVYLALSLVLITGFVLRLYKIDNPIADWHSWRQVDTASVTKFLLKDGDVLNPKYFDISKVQTGFENPKGYRFVEFPIFNLFHVLLIKVLPFSFEVNGRLVSIIAATFTSLFLYLISEKMHSRKLGLITAFLYSTLPYNIYFTRVILPDPLAVTFGVSSVYFFMKFTEKENLSKLLISASLMGAGLLVKPHTIFFAIPILLLAIKKFGLKKLLAKWSLFVALDIALIPFIAWRGWMNYGDRFVGIPHFLWSFNGNEIRFKPSFFRWIFGERISKLILGYWGVIPFGFGAITRKTPGLISMFLLAGFLYLSIFASANVMHDYYQIFIIPAICLATGFGLLSMWDSSLVNKKATMFLGVLILIMIYSTSAFYIKENYNINDTRMLRAANLIDQTIPLNSKVIAPYNGDTTFLYHTNRMGWPVVTSDINSMIEMGAEYFVSTNYSDQDTINFSKKFETVSKSEEYIILNLNKTI